MARKNNSNRKKVRRKFHGFRFITTLLAVAVGFEVVFGTVAYVGVQNMLEGKPTLNTDDLFSQESTLIYDREGNQIADVGMQLRENVSYDQIPEAMIDAFLSVEDSRYFTHNGFDVPRFTSSIINTVAGRGVQGGSTFTMQLVKLTYFQNDENGTSRTKDIQYKIQQIALALELEKVSTKKEIFELYLNKMNFGGVGNIRGVEKASEQYFGKSVSELNISECALLAGIVNSPYYYDPHNYLDHAVNRRDTVLYLMLRHGYINEDEYKLAKSIKVEDLLINPATMLDNNNYKYQAYIDEAIKEAQEITGQDPLNVSMEIYTAMDPVVQDKMEEICAGNAGISYVDDLMEVGIISENNQTGEIVGIGGGRNYAAGGSMLLNHATAQYKQPGSSVKPFMDYALAFEYAGWATTHEVVDKPLTYGNWTYKNANGQYHGRVNIMQALAASYNTPAIQALQAAIDAQGFEVVDKYLQNLHFSSYKPELFSIGFAIGGDNFTVTPKELMAAHAIIMNGGYYIKPHTITKIVYRSGKQDDLIPNFEHKQVLSAEAAYLTSTLMQYAVEAPFYNYLDVLVRNYPVYGKTGTTDWGNSGLQYGIPNGAQKDKWMVAETTEYTTAVWLGWEKAVQGGNNYFTNYTGNLNIPGRICSQVLDVLQRNSSPAGVQRPDGVSDITHIKGIFPYVSPTDAIPDDMIATGMIKSEYAKLSSFEEAIDPLDNLASFSAEQNGDSLDITMNWASYPNPEKLELASSNDKTFDISWITGKVIYKARIEQNGQTLGEISSTDPSTTQTVSGLEYNTPTRVCGYYGYENTSDMSNEVCSSFTTGEDPTPKPMPTPTPTPEVENPVEEPTE